MDARRLAFDGPLVGAVGLGCMGMSWAYAEPNADLDGYVAVVRRAVELAVSLLDTADVYGPLANEELVGRALQTCRAQAVVATKCGLVVTDAGNYRLRADGRPEHVLAACEGSMKRLGVEAIDLYQLHRVDPEVPIEETWGAMAALVAAGKVRAIGLSEVSPDVLDRAHAVHPVASVQSELSLWTRDRLVDVVPWCLDHGAAFIAFAPLGRGFLTGTYRDRAQLAPGDFRLANPRFQDDALAANVSIVDRVEAVAGRHGASAGQVALAWALAHGDHVIPIPGTKRLGHLAENAGATEIVLDGDDLAELDLIPAAVGMRY